MIQLPSKIRTTLFNASVEEQAYQLFSHENDRILAIIYPSYYVSTLLTVGRSGQDVSNNKYNGSVYYYPLKIYGPEPLWIGLDNSVSGAVPTLILVHAIYRA